jgi:hypothetical protein
MSYSYLTGQLGHPQLQFTFFLPLGALLFFRWLQKRNFWRAFAFGLAWTACFLSSVYLSLFLLFSAAALLLALLLLRPRSLTTRAAWQGAAGALCGALPAIPFLLPYLAVRRTFGARNLYEAAAFGADIVSYFSSTPLNLVYGFTSAWSKPEAQLFPGLAVFILGVAAYSRLIEAPQLRKLAVMNGIAGLCVFGASFAARNLAGTAGGKGALYLLIVSSWLLLSLFCRLLYRLGALERKLGFDVVTNRALIGMFALLALAAFLASLGPIGNPALGELPLGFYTAVRFVIPGLEGLRATSRLGVIVIFALSVGVSFSLAFIPKFKLWRWPVSALLLGIVVAENYNAAYPLEGEEPAPEIVEKLNALPPSSEAVLFLPLGGEIDANGKVQSWGDYAEKNVLAMHWGFALDRPVVNGYSGIRSKSMFDLARQLASFPDERSVEALASIAGLRYIVYSPKLAAKFDRLEFLGNLARVADSFRVLSEDGNGNFLLDFVPARNIDKNTVLLVPSHGRGLLSIDLRADAGGKGDKVPVAISADAGGSVTSLDPVEVTPDGNWQTFQVLLPSLGDGVRPLVLRFSAPPEVKTQIGRTGYARSAAVK